MEGKHVAEWRIEWQADHEQYWQGHGISCTPYTHCFTGCGETLREALDDALEQMAMDDFTVIGAFEHEAEAELANQVAKGYTLDTSVVEAFCDANGEHEEEEPDCAVCAGEWHFYVSIDLVVEG